MPCRLALRGRVVASEPLPEWHVRALRRPGSRVCDLPARVRVRRRLHRLYHCSVRAGPLLSGRHGLCDTVCVPPGVLLERCWAAERVAMHALSRRRVLCGLR